MGKGRFLIRQIRPDETDVFQRIRLEALHCAPAYFASQYEDWATLPDGEWRQRLNDPVFVAFDQGEPVGIMGLLRFRPRKMAHRAALVMVYVRNSCRGTGLAKAMLEVVVTFARAKGILQIELGVSADNPGALGFYQKNGFFEIGRMPDGFMDEGRGTDEVVMLLKTGQSLSKFCYLDAQRLL